MPAWRPLPPAASGVDWTAPAPGLDPYLAWLETIDFAARDAPAGEPLPVAIELAAGGGPLLRQLQQDGRLWVPPVWRDADDGLRFCTAFATPAAMPGLLALPGRPVRRIEQGLVCRPRAPGTEGDGKPSLWQRFLAWLSSGVGAAVDFVAPPAPRKVLAFIDDGCAFAHPQFRRPGGAAATRVRRLWDQGRVGSGAPWHIPPGFGYGMEVSDDAGDGLQTWMQSMPSAGGADAERACYAAAGIDVPPAPNGVWHGTHVMDLACGFPNPLQPQQPRDAAAEADILFVQLPREAIPDHGGGWLAVHVLDGLRYVLQHTHERDNVVVNLSLGAQAGPHDGSSLLEQAIDDLIARERPRNFAVVVAAGNSFDTDGHAELTLAAGGTQTLQWDVAPSDATDSYLEVWLPPGADAVEIEVVPPVNEAPSSGFQRTGSALQYCKGPKADQPTAMLLYSAADAGGAQGAFALLAVAPTASVEGYPLQADAGNWEVKLRNLGAAPVTVHAWIERDANAWGFGGKPSKFNGHVQTTHTVASVAGGRHTISVGGLTVGAPLTPTYASFSSSGPSRVAGARVGPDLAAPADRFDPLEPGVGAPLTAAGPLSDSQGMLKGTSMAAPVVARRVLNLLAARQGDMSRADILAALAPGGAPNPQAQLRGTPL